MEEFSNPFRKVSVIHEMLLQCHDIEFADDFERVFTETADVLHRLKAEGKATLGAFTLSPEDVIIESADKPGYWQSVTGSLDSEGEALDATARREVLEETGIDVDAVGGVLRALHDHERRPSILGHQLDVVYLAPMAGALERLALEATAAIGRAALYSGLHGQPALFRCRYG